MAPYGLSVETAASGYEAIDKVKGGASYDIVFMDHFMPGMDGIEAAKIMRDLGYAHPIIALTANALAGQAEMFLSNGFDGFISKPIDIRQLNTTLVKLIRDKYPPEVVEAAVRLKAGVKSRLEGEDDPHRLDSKLAEVFIRDAEKAIAALETIIANKFRRVDDMHMFVINVHAMKSALANIGEPDLSESALNLENAGRENNMREITGKVLIFLSELKALLEKLRPQEDDEVEMDVTDMAFLRERLLAVQTACANYDKKAVKEAMKAINAKKWPRLIKDQLSSVSGYILHSDFEEAAKAVADMICQIKY
jgi:CheY-like chemotaxis protein